MTRITRRQAGFTLMELLVALAITVLITTLAGMIFQETSTAVSRGKAISGALTGARTVADRLRQDAEAMLGPEDVTSDTGDSGVLAIVQKSYDTPDVIDPDTGGIVTSGRDIRSDQLIFIRDISGNKGAPASPIAPEDGDTYDADIGNERRARVWYGHLRRTRPDGQGGDPLNVPGNNAIATRWDLGRQLLFLQDPPGLSGGTHAKSPRQDSDVADGITGDLPGGLPQKLFMGITDRTNEFHVNTSGDFSLFGDTGTSDYILANGDSFAEYRDDTYDIFFSNERLRVTPQIAAPSPNGPNKYYESWQIAQTHPLLMSNVSDFIVQFAGDYAPVDDQIDTDGDGNIVWYDHFGGSPPTPRAVTPTAGNITGPTDGKINDPDNDQTPIYEPGRTHPQNDGSIPGAYTSNVDAMFVWRHDDDTLDATDSVSGSEWPHLLRIRMRVHDPRGRMTGRASSGMWVERIIQVERRP